MAGHWLHTLLIALLLVACTEKKAEQSVSPAASDTLAAPAPAKTTRQPEVPGAVSAMGVCLDNLRQHTEQLRLATDHFLEQVNDDSLKTVRQRWRDTHAQWHRCDLYLRWFDRPELMVFVPSLHENTIEPGYVDAVEGYPHSGLVNDTSIPMTESSLRDQHQQLSREESSLGLHVIELMLWRHTLDDYNGEAELNAKQKTNGMNREDLPTHRRRQYLHLLASLLAADSKQLQQQFQGLASGRAMLPATRLDIVMTMQLLDMMRHRSDIADADWQLAALEEYREQLLNHRSTTTDKKTKQVLEDAFSRLSSALKQPGSAQADLQADFVALLAAIDSLSPRLSGSGTQGQTRP